MLCIVIRESRNLSYETRFTTQIPCWLRNRFIAACRESGTSEKAEIQSFLEKRIDELEAIPAIRQENPTTAQLSVHIATALCSTFDQLSRERGLTRNEQIKNFVEKKTLLLEREIELAKDEESQFDPDLIPE